MKDIEIAVNARHLIYHQMEGIGWFSYQMMKRIVQTHSDIHFYFLFDRNFNDEFIFGNKVTPIILSPPARHPLLIYYWNEWLVPNLLNRLKPDLYLSLDGFISKRAQYKQYAVVHDVNFIIFPQYLTWSVKKLYNYFFTKHIHHTSRLATVSEFSKSEITKYLHYPQDKIDVVYSASNIKKRNINDDEEKKIKSQHTKGKNYFLYASSIHPRKNIVGIIKAFDEYKKKINNEDQLVIVGRFFWGKKEVMNTLNDIQYKNDIIFTGRLDDDTTMLLMKFAKALILVSHYEGFGVPIIEAMQLGTPVITSNTTALNEISNDAAIKVNPDSIQEIARAMQEINNNYILVENLIKKGYHQAKKFNWDKCAELLWNSIKKEISTIT